MSERSFEYRIVLAPQAAKDLKFWHKNNHSKVVRIAALLESMVEDPYAGIGKPKALHYDFEGLWSRRIDPEHRVVYQVIGEVIEIQSLRGHYGDK